MALRKLTFIHPDGKNLNVELEETMVVDSFLDHLKSQEILDFEINYSLVTEGGAPVSDGDTFSNFKERKFIIQDPNKIVIVSNPNVMEPGVIETPAPTPSATPNPGFVIGAIDTPRQFHQLGIFVLDGSGSMGGQAAGGLKKSDSVNVALRELLTRFKVSGVKQNFSFAVVSFDTSAQVRNQVTEAAKIDDNADYNPMNGHGGGTNIYEGLKTAEQIANNFLSQNVAGGAPHSVVILLMTDGACSSSSTTKQVADSIKNGANGGRITFCTTLFQQVGSKDERAKELLRYIATDPVQGFKEIYDAETLRTFFMKSISLASGTNVE